jgi:hypothetical protein
MLNTGITLFSRAKVLVLSVILKFQKTTARVDAIVLSFSRSRIEFVATHPAREAMMNKKKTATDCILKIRPPLRTLFSLYSFLLHRISLSALAGFAMTK